jgi:hypothetical protein
MAIRDVSWLKVSSLSKILSSPQSRARLDEVAESYRHDCRHKAFSSRDDSCGIRLYPPGPLAPLRASAGRSRAERGTGMGRSGLFLLPLRPGEDEAAVEGRGVLGGDAGGALALGQAASTAIFGLMALKGFRAELSPCPYAGKSAENAQEGAGEANH